jgi:hypothetical protein
MQDVVGLERLSGVLTSLRLSLESPCTVLVAVLIVREFVARLELTGVLSIFASLARILPAVQNNSFLTGLID